MSVATGEITVTEIRRYVHAIAWGGYVNFIVSGIVAFLAGKYALSVWRRKPSTEPLEPTLVLREEDILYHGPTLALGFAEVIGAAGDTIDWRRAAGFAAACLALHLPAILNGSLFDPLMEALATAAAAVAAFHFIRRPVAAAFAAAAGSALAIVYIFQQGEFLATFASNAALLLALVWATPRIAPLSYALGLGALIGAAAQWIVDAIAYGDSLGAGSVVLAIIAAALFTTCLLVVLRRTGPQST